jgi:hypothetical protein
LLLLSAKLLASVTAQNNLMQAPWSKLFANCLILGTRERLSSQLTLYSLIVMSMLILQDLTNVILMQALQTPSLASASLFLLVEYLLCGAHSFSKKFPSVLLWVNIQVCHRQCIPFCQSAHSWWKWHPTIGLQKALVATIHTRVLENNNGAYLLASYESMYYPSH